jgi:hypothetical protein
MVACLQAPVMGVAVFTPGDGWRRGTYKGFRWPDGRRMARICCVGCGQTATLMGDQITASGGIPGDIVCRYSGCPRFDHGLLEGWAVA